MTQNITIPRELFDRMVAALEAAYGAQGVTLEAMRLQAPPPDERSDD